MATVYGVNRTLANDPQGGSILSPGLSRGKVRAIVDTYEAASLASGSIIEMGDKIPKNAKVIGLRVYADALGSGVTIKAGDYEDDDRYFDAEAFNTADKIKEADEIDGVVYEVDETVPATLDSQLILTTGGAAATGTIKTVMLIIEE